MLAYAVIASSSGTPVDPRRISRIATDAESHLHFEPEERLVWSNAARSIHILAWQAFIEIAGIGSHWSTAPDHVTAFSGHVWPRPSGWTAHSQSWADQLRTHLEHQDILAIHEDLYGSFTVVDLPADGVGHIVTDSLGIGLLYHAQTPEFTIFSTRASIAAMAITDPDQQPARDPLAAGWLCFWGSTMGNASGFVGVKRLPPDSFARLDPVNGASIRRRQTPFWQLPGDTTLPASHDELQRLLYDDLASSLHSIAAVPASQREIRLSGGKDSRLLAAIVLQEQLGDRISFMTYGLPGTSDVIAARQVAETRGLNWTFEDRSLLAHAATAASFRIHAFQVEGTTNAWDLCSDLKPDNRLVVTGNFGEFVRIAATSIRTLSATSADEVLDVIRTKKEFDIARLLKPEMSAHYREVAVAWAREHIERGADFRDVGSFLYPNFRAPGWTGPSRAAKSALWTMPYATPMVFRIGQALPHHERATQRFHFDLLTRLDPSLARMPLAGDRWPEELYQRRDDAELFRQTQPVLAASSTPASWHLRQFQTERSFFEDVLLDRTNPIYHVLRYERVEQLVALDSPSGGTLRYLFAALTGAIWLGQLELPARIERETAVVSRSPPAAGSQRRSVKMRSLRPAPRSNPRPH